MRLTQLSCSFLLCSLIIFSGCTGEIELTNPVNLGGLNNGSDNNGTLPQTGGKEINENGKVAFSCGEDEISVIPLRKLSRIQMGFILYDVLSDYGLDDIGDQAIDQLALLMPHDTPQPVSRELPTQTGELGFSRLDQNVDQLHIDALFQLAVWLGPIVANAPTVVGLCAKDGDGTNDEQCKTDFIEGLGAKLLRRPLDAQDKIFYDNVFDKYQTSDTDLDDEAIRAVVITLVTSPQFFYAIEKGDGNGKITSVELANRIALQFWQSLPDEALFAAAADGSLIEDLPTHVERVFNDSKTDRSLDSFFREWFWGAETIPENLERLRGEPVFDAFAADANVSDNFRERSRNALINTAIRMTREGYTFEQLLTSNEVMTDDAEIAALYGVSPWDGTGKPPLAENRAGLITRIALVGSGDTSTRPVRKGFFIRQGLLCESVPAPDAAEAANGIPLLPEMTTRQRVEATTEVGSCQGCHLVYLNGLGYITENYDGFGRPRTEEAIYADDASVVKMVSVNTNSSIRIAGSKARDIDDVNLLTEWLNESGAVNACFVQHYFRFTFGREETLGSDGCALENMRKISESSSLAEVMKAVVLQTHFLEKPSEVLE